MFTLVKAMVESLPYDAKTKYQFAVDIFSTTIKHPIPFNGYTDKATLLRKIDRIPYMSSTTKTDRALLEAMQISFGKRNGARDSGLGFPKVLVLITGRKFYNLINLSIVTVIKFTSDGESNEPSLTEKASQEVKKAGIEIFTIGIGKAFKDKLNKDELQNVASHPKCMHMYLVENFRSLLAGK